LNITFGRDARVQRQLEFRLRERDRFASFEDHAGFGLDLEVSYHDAVQWLGLHPAQQGTYPSDQLAHHERLRNVVVAAGLQTDHDVDGIGLRGQEDDRQVARLADLPAEFEPIASRQHDVQDREVRLAVREEP
jgi:hypothetical protein